MRTYWPTGIGFREHWCLDAGLECVVGSGEAVRLLSVFMLSLGYMDDWPLAQCMVPFSFKYTETHMAISFGNILIGTLQKLCFTTSLGISESSYDHT